MNSTTGAKTFSRAKVISFAKRLYMEVNSISRNINNLEEQSKGNNIDTFKNLLIAARADYNATRNQLELFVDEFGLTEDEYSK